MQISSPAQFLGVLKPCVSLLLIFSATVLLFVRQCFYAKPEFKNTTNNTKKNSTDFTTIWAVSKYIKFVLANLIEINCLIIRFDGLGAKYEFWWFEISQKQFLVRYNRWIQEVKTHLSHKYIHNFQRENDQFITLSIVYLLNLKHFIFAGMCEYCTFCRG